MIAADDDGDDADDGDDDDDDDDDDDGDDSADQAGLLRRKGTTGAPEGRKGREGKGESTSRFLARRISRRQAAQSTLPPARRGQAVLCCRSRQRRPRGGT